MSKPEEDKKEDCQNKEDGQNKTADFSWKKNGFDIREHLTLKNNALEASAFQEEQQKQKLKSPLKQQQNLPLGLLKLKKKVREVYDEEDDEEDYIYTPLSAFQVNPEEDDGRLIKGLSDNEKLMLKQKETLNTVKALQDAGKMEALHVAHNLAKDVGLKGLSEKNVAASMQEALFKPKEMQKKVVQKEVSNKLGIKGKVEDGKIIQAARGIKKVENLGGVKATKNLDMKDVIKVGEDKLDEIKLAELILKKSGQKVQKRKDNVQKSKDKMDLKYLEGEKKPSKKEKSDITDVKRKNSDFSR